MASNKKELQVAALCNGTVIDHIPSNVVFKCVKILGIEKMTSAITIGNNLDSGKLGHKGIIKIADVTFPEAVINRIALLAPTAVINIIKDYEVVEKYPVTLPSLVRDIVKCDNSKCITNNEPMATKFDVVGSDSDGVITIRCSYCGHVMKATDAIIK